MIGASDMARWIVAAAAGRTGAYNAVAPAVPLARVFVLEAEVVWVPWGYLEDNGVQPWTDLPAWLPAPMAALLMADGTKAADAGLSHRSIEAVVADIAAWDRARPQEPLKAGLTREREAELLRKFRAAGPPLGP